MDIDHTLPHLDWTLVQRGDTVVGTLPIHLAARVCEAGARYFHLTLNLPAELRGQELSADHLEALGASLQAFEVTPIHHPNPKGLLQP
jgi:CRISPR-associated protein Csx16